MGFGEALRAELVGVGMKPPLYKEETVAAVPEDIVSFAPSSGKYPVLVLFQCTTDTDGCAVELQVLDKDGVTWHKLLKVRLLGNTAFAMGFPALKLNKVNSGETEYEVKAGDGATATLKAVATEATGDYEVFLWVGEES